ncbi:MAG: glucose-6-phosphate isomerase [Actinomycetia bacterium]|nr:glucose-6-phosphate isomerase [Actinomycetes bacterium]
MTPESPLMESCLQRLLTMQAASRLGAADPTLFAQYPDQQELTSRRLGWVHLASRPPVALSEIISLAQAVLDEGLDAVVLIGQGGSSQASMTITKLHEVAHGGQHEFGGDGRQRVVFRTMDSLSPVFVNHILGSSDPSRTLYIISSKSGSTIEPLMLERVAWHYVAGHLGNLAAGRRFVAITESQSPLAEMAAMRGYRLVLDAAHSVGGRFSALSLSTLLPAALVGIDIEAALRQAASTEAACVLDNEDNPALQLACFLYAAYLSGRDKFSLVMPPSGQVFGLWVEQMIAESLGKDGLGILPNVEVDASILAHPHPDRSVITYAVGEVEGFAESIANIDASIPQRHLTIDDPAEAFSRFIVWEYATAFLGLLMGVYPFDQPDVELTKTITRQILAGEPESTADSYQQFPALDTFVGSIRLSQPLVATLAADSETPSLDSLLRALLASIQPGDYFALNAFLPFRGYGRREALERIRNRVASRLGAVSCLEIGPRYLHSTGQLQKGGPDNGVFLILSADELDDLVIPGENLTLGRLAATQARADFIALAERGRRVLHVHLLDNGSETLSRFADRFCSAVSAIPK